LRRWFWSAANAINRCWSARAAAAWKP